MAVRGPQAGNHCTRTLATSIFYPEERLDSARDTNTNACRSQCRASVTVAGILNKNGKYEYGRTAVKFQDIGCHKNSYAGHWLVTCGQTDGQTQRT